MALPFSFTNTYTTPLTRDQLLTLLSRLQPSSKLFQLYEVDNYAAELSDQGFILRHAHPRQNLPAMPPIVGEIIQEHPTTIRVTIAPSYFVVAIMLLFSVGFGLAALFSDNWTINAVHRAPVLTERVEILLGAGGGPLVLGYVCAIRPVKKAKDWLVEKLALQ